jgi:hypothetical protein
MVAPAVVDLLLLQQQDKERLTKVLLVVQPERLEVMVAVAQVRLVILMVLDTAAMEFQHLFQDLPHFMQVAVVATMLVIPAAMAAVVLLQQMELLIEVAVVVLGMETQPPEMVVRELLF